MAYLASKHSIGKECTNFQRCEVVFAKLKGFPKWPAQINNIEGNVYTVVYFGTYQWYKHSANTLFKIGPKRKNPVVEANEKNSLFMKAWEECTFILDTLFEGNHYEGSDSIAAIKPATRIVAMSKKKTMKRRVESGLDSTAMEPPVEFVGRKMTRASTKKTVVDPDSSLKRQTTTVQHVHSVRSNEAGQRKVTHATHKNQQSSECVQHVHPVRSNEAAQRKVTRATHKKQNSSECESENVVPTYQPLKSNPIPAVQWKVTRAMSKLMAIKDPSPEYHSENVEPLKRNENETKTNSVLIVRRKVTRAKAHAEKSPLLENSSFISLIKSGKRKAECEPVPIPKKKKKPGTKTEI